MAIKISRRFIKSTYLAMISLVPFVLYTNCSGGIQTSESDSGSATSSSTGSFSGNFSGNLEYVSTDGRAWGFARDNVFSSTKLKILFYSNGPVGTGTYIGSTLANQNFIGSNSGYYFSYQIPASLKNGQAQNMYAYVDSAKPQNLIQPGSVRYASYTPKAEATFNSQVMPYIAVNCTGCHNWTYSALYNGPLLNPLSINGGTATNNKIIRKISGAESHGGGGNVCTEGINAGFCASLQNWWRAEFL